MVMRDIIPNRMITLSTPFARGGYAKIGGRATIVKLEETGSLAVFSPVALTDDVRSKIATLGDRVRYIAATDIEHHIFVGPWAKAWPEAEVIGVEGLPEKREKDEATKGTRFAHIFTASNKRDVRISPEFDREFDYEYVDSHVNRELVFYHRPTATMIEADLIMNLPAHEQYSRSEESPTSGILTRIATMVMNTSGDALWQKRMMWYLASSKNRSAFNESVARMKRWRLARIVPCHGEVIESDAQGIFDRITQWHREQDTGK